MAQHRTTVLIDDLDGGRAERTVSFSLDGDQYEIDLTAQHIEQLHRALAPFIATARTTGGERTGRRRSGPSPTAPTDARADAPVDANVAASAPAEPAAGQTTVDTGDQSGHGPLVPAAVFSSPTEPVSTFARHTGRGAAPALFCPAS